jgi:hypothetical protein
VLGEGLVTLRTHDLARKLSLKLALKAIRDFGICQKKVKCLTTNGSVLGRPARSGRAQTEMDWLTTDLALQGFKTSQPAACRFPILHHKSSMSRMLPSQGRPHLKATGRPFPVMGIKWTLQLDVVCRGEA